MSGLCLFVVFMAMLLLGAPISFSLGLGTMAACTVGGYSLSSLPLLITNGASSYTLVAIPYFVLLGNLMNTAGITDRIFDWAEAAVGHIKGGLAHANVLASVVFAGVSGTSTADAAGLGMVEINAMTKKGYPVDFTTAITMASAVLGPIIPPSVTLLIYATLSSTSVAKLFMAGMVPGLLVALILCVTSYILYVTGKVKMPAPVRFSLQRFVKATKRGVFALLCPLILLYFMSSGIVTPTEAGIIGVVYSLAIGLCYRSLSWKVLFDALKMTVESCTLIMFLIGMGSTTSWFLTAERIPSLITDILLGLTENKYLILLLINVILLVLGMFMDGTSIQLIMVPILLPIIDLLGVSRITFGVMVTINILIGTITPPFGVSLFIMTNIAKIPFERVVKSSVPFYIPLILALLAITYIPAFTLWLPNLLY